MMLLTKKSFLSLLLLICSTGAFAQTYLCQDSSGLNLYTDKNLGPQCIVAHIGKINTYPTKKKKALLPTSVKKTSGFGPGSAMMGAAAVISPATQAGRDAKRRQVLTGELGREANALKLVQEKLREVRLKRQKEEVKELERELYHRRHNIDLIQKELSRG